MFEKVNPCHPDKIADRIAGAIVDLAYKKSENPKIAVEVLLGHGDCYIILETSESIKRSEIKEIVNRIAMKEVKNVIVKSVPQDIRLANNQSDMVRCGDNGIFRGVPVSEEQKKLSKVVRKLYKSIPYDGKFIIDEEGIIACQSRVETETLKNYIKSMCDFKKIKANPLGDWYGGLSVDSGATNRKLGSDMGDAVTGGGLHGKDLSKADVSVNIYAHLKAQKLGKPVELHCAIGDETVDGKPYSEIVAIASDYIKDLGGFEKFAEWGLI